MCCQESGEREASVSLFCPRAKPGEKKFRKVRFPLVSFALAADDPRPGTSGESRRINVRTITRFSTDRSLQSAAKPSATTASLPRPYCFRIAYDRCPIGDQDADAERGPRAWAPDLKRRRREFSDCSGKFPSFFLREEDPCFLELSSRI